MPRFLCRICRYSTPMSTRIAHALVMYLHCTQGMPGAPFHRWDNLMTESALQREVNWL